MRRYLKNFVVAETHRADEIQSVLADLYDAHSFEAERDNGFFAAVAYFDFGSSNLSYCSYRTPVRMSFRENDFVLVQVPLAGRGRTSIGAHSTETDERTIVCSPAEGTFEFGPSYEQLLTRIDQGTLEDDITRLIGLRPKQHLTFEFVTDSQAGPASRLREIIISTARSIDVSDDPIPQPLLQEMENLIRLAVLYGIPNNFSDLLYAAPKLSAPWQVKKIEEWIDAHWLESVTIKKLAEISGASVRSIFAAFKKTRGYTPMAYLRKVRLNAARELLLSGAPGISVTGVSLACNFKNTGNFARDYQIQFGEFPSETLRRGKSGLPKGA
jgi:AraC-like DNA-binding protein